LLKFLKTKFPLFTLSLVLSFIFWLMVSASAKSLREITVSLVIVLPNEKEAVLGEPLPDKINVRVEANTAQFKLIENRNLSIKVDLSKEELGSHLIRFTNEDTLKELQLPRGVIIQRVQPSEIPYHLYGFITKVVPVEMTQVDTYSELLVVNGPITIDPTEVSVTGPSNIMEELNSLPIVVSRASVKPEVKLEVKPNISSFFSSIVIDPKVVFMATPNVSWKRSTINVPVPVSIEVVPPAPFNSNYSFLANPDIVNVTVSWPANHQQPLPGTSGGLQAVVTGDLKELERLGGKRLEVSVNLPFQDLEVIRTSPSKIYVTLKRLPNPVPEPANLPAPEPVPETLGPGTDDNLSAPPTDQPSDPSGSENGTADGPGL
jgi:hypothetical protein